MSWRAQLVARRWLSPDVFELDLARPPAFVFRPGQGLRIAHRGRDREYTLVSHPGNPLLTLCIRIEDRGELSGLLGGLETGGVLEVSGPHGYFDWTPSPRPAVFVATGIGITPFVAMTRAGARPRYLAHGVRRAGDLHYRALLQGAARTYVPCLTAEPPVSRPDGAFPGRVTAWLEALPESRPLDFYLCGGRGMIAAVTEIVDRRFPGSRILTMAFR